MSSRRRPPGRPSGPVRAPRPRGPYVPPGREAADRHAAFAFDLIERVAAGDRQGAAQLISRLRTDSTIDPWTLAMGLAAMAARRPCGRAHPPEENSTARAAG